MASNSRQSSGSSARSTNRRKVVISGSDGAQQRRKTQPKRKADSPRATRSTERSEAARKAAATRREQRERRLRGQRLRARLKVAGAVAAVALVVVGAVAVYRSSIFAVSSVEVVGNEQLSTHQVLERAAVPADATLLRFPADEVRDRLVSDPWISDAVVSRDFPDTMRIRLTERVPAAYVDVGDEAFWLVDPSGFAIARQTPDTTVTLVVVRDIEDAALEAGAQSESESLLNALRVWQGLSAELAAQVRAVSAPAVDKTTLITVDDIEILVGSADDIGKKDLIAREILREHAGVVVYVNVRTVDRPTWRGLDE